MKTLSAAAMILITSAAVGCATASVSPEEGEAVMADDTLEPQQTIYSTNASGTWSAAAQVPTSNVYYATVSGSAIFGGPGGQTRRMGVCLLRRAGATTCNSAGDCPAPPAGGFSYCTAPDGVGQKYCYQRPGSAASYCAGTPALGGNPPVWPGTFSTPSAAATDGSTWISYACFEGCAATDPSSSSAKLVQCNPTQGRLQLCFKQGGTFNMYTCLCEL
jgi:hypothetical protein